MWVTEVEVAGGGRVSGDAEDEVETVCCGPSLLSDGDARVLGRIVAP